MKKFCFIFSILCCLMLVTACSKNAGPVVSNTAGGNSEELASKQDTLINGKKPAATPEVIATYYTNSGAEKNLQVPEEKFIKSWNGLSEKAGDAIEYAYEAVGLLDEAVNKESSPVPFICAGMKHKNPVIRWYCANKIIDFYDMPVVKDALEPLNKLSVDSEQYVRDSAQLSLAVINKTYDSKYILKSHDGSRYLFMRFYGPRYNNGKLWLISKGAITQIADSYCIGDFGWSPDDKWLYFNSYGRIQSEIAVVNVESKKVYSADVFKYICENGNKLGYKIGSNQRPDPWIKFIEWSPDISKILLSYSFNDDKYIGQKGIAVFDNAKHSIEKVIPLGPSNKDYEELKKPADFNWHKF